MTNKNNFIFWFLHYIVHYQKIVHEVIVNYMVPGHTKFSVDSAFGVTKKYLNKRDIETYEDLL